jgi:hypothetical protein
MMKFAYFNPTIMSVDEMADSAYVRLKDLADKAHAETTQNDDGNPTLSVRGGSQVHLFPDDFNLGLDIKPLKDYVEGACREFLANVISTSGRTELEDFEPVLISAWTIRQNPGDYQALHNHEAHLSGVSYIDVPDFENERDSDGCIEFRFPVIRNPANLIFVDQWRYKPEPKTSVIFPSYLSHGVYPWQGQGYRTCIAWDVQLVSKST